MDAFQRVVQGVQGFADEMREKGVHLGLGKEPRCVVDGEPWPCSHERASRTSDDS